MKTAIELLKEARAQLAYISSDKHTEEIVLSIDSYLAQPEQGEKLAKLGWQEIDCPICGGGARVFPKQEQEPAAWPVLNTEEREALERFNETCEDGQEYDVSKSMMKHLAELGVVYSAGFGRYGFTEFGRAALNHPQPKEPEQKHVALKKGECWPEEIMRQWDYWRKEIANGHKGSAPRDWFEGLSELKLIDTIPPQRKPLTDEQIFMCVPQDGDLRSFAKAIEDAHGIKK